ncbi:MAG: hypothetical protein C4523_14430 [Myxococcales bacterium]|nr:MAG: hypothetical protein C4523_14430 [Myxococcales bacterium]
MKRRFCLLLSLFFAALTVWRPGTVMATDSFATLTVAISRSTSYSVEKGSNAGEVILIMENYPADAISQLEKQFGEHLVAMQVLEMKPDTLRLKLIILPVAFELAVKRRLSPQALVIEFFPPLATETGASATVPPTPMWEMLTDGTAVLPLDPYGVVKGEGEAYAQYISLVNLYRIGALDAALTQLKEALRQSDGAFWREYLLLAGETLFDLARLHGRSATDALRALLAAEPEQTDPAFKARVILLVGYANLLLGNLDDASQTFARGLSAHPEAALYFLLGQLQATIERGDRRSADQIAKVVGQASDLPEAVRAKLCVVEVMWTLREGGVKQANALADQCLTRHDQGQALGLGQLLAVAEARLLSHRFGEAKDLLQRVVRDFPDHAKAPMAAMRLGDALYHEQRWTESEAAYELTVLRWPDTPFAKLAAMRRAEVEAQVSARQSPAGAYLEEDLHLAPEPVDREAKLRLMWLFEALSAYDTAYLYLVDLFRRYDGLRYWTFQRDRLSAIVMNAFKDYERRGEPLEIIRLYQAKDPLPLSPDVQDRITIMAADAYLALGKGQEAVRVYQEALARPSRTYGGERQILLDLTLAYLAQNDIYRAEKTQEFFISRYAGDEDQASHYLMLAEIDEAKGEFGMSMAVLEKALKYVRDPAQAQKIALRIGRIAYKQKNYEKTVERFSPVLMHILDRKVIIDPSIIPDEVRNAAYGYADSLCQLGRYAACLDAYERANILFPADSRRPIAQYFSAVCLLKLGRKAEAMLAFDALTQSNDPFWQEVGRMRSITVDWIAKHELSLQ